MSSPLGSQQSSLRQWVAGFGAACILLPPANDPAWAFEAEDDIPEGLTTLKNIALVILGTILGAILADRFGRRLTLLAALIFVIPRLIHVIYDDEEWTWILELFTEFGSGITFTVVPLYISEIASTNNRKNLLVLQLLAYWIGMTAMVVLVLIYQYTELSASTVTYIDLAILVTAVVFHAITMAIFPETPHYLNAKKRYQEASKSLAFYRGIPHVKIREDTLELTTNGQTYNARQTETGCRGKISEIARFENRRSLAIIFSLIVIRWVSGQYRNNVRLSEWYHSHEDFEHAYATAGVFGIKLIFIVFTLLAIGLFHRKLSLILVILVSFIAAVISFPIFHLNPWIILVVSLIQHFGHIILIGVTLVYTGEFFSINVRAMATAILISFEILIRNISFVTDNPQRKVFLNADYIPYYYLGAAVFFLAFFFILVFFPKVNKVSNFELAIETSLPC